MTQSAKKNEDLEVPSGGIGAFAMSEEDFKAIEVADAEQEFGTAGLGQFSAVAQRMAGYGRFGDDSIAHVQTGEIIIPLALIENNPQLKEQIFQSFRDQGMQDPERYVVGSDGNYINPETGQMEFFSWKKAWNNVKGVLGTVVKIALPLALAATPLGPIYGAAMGSGIATLLTGGSVEEALNSALVSGATGAVMVGVTGGGLEGVGKALKDPVSRVSETAKGALSGETKLFRSFEPAERGTLERLGGKADDKIGETFFPEDVTPDQVLQRGTNPINPVDATPTQWDRAKTIAKQESPGMIRKTAPLVLAATAVVGGAASLGAFDEEEPEGIIEKDSEGNMVTGQDLIDADPSKYTIELPDYSSVDYSNSTVPTNYPGPADTVATDTTDESVTVDPIVVDPIDVDPITGEPVPQTPMPYNPYEGYVMSSMPTGPFALPQIAQMAGGGPVQYFAQGGKVQYMAGGGMTTDQKNSGTSGFKSGSQKKKERNDNSKAASDRADDRRKERKRAQAKKEEEERLAAEILAEQQAADAAAQAAKDQAAADQAAAIQAAVDKALEEKAAEEAIAAQAAEAERVKKQQLIDDQAAIDAQDAADQAAEDKAAKDAQAVVDQAAAEQAAIDKAAADQAVLDQLAADQAAADLLASERLAAQAEADRIAEEKAAQAAQDRADRIAAAEAEAARIAFEEEEAIRIAAEEAEAARIAQENFAVNYAANNPINLPRRAPAPSGSGVYNPQQDAQTLADSSAAPYEDPFVVNDPAMQDPAIQDPLAVNDTFGLDSYADYSQIIDPYTAIDFTVPTVKAPTVQPNDFTLYADNPFYTAPVTLADGGHIFPRREGGIAPTEGTPGKDSVRAMLMPGEFIMTTDAVKGLGNGNVDKGIKSMYSVMRNLEQRGRNA